MQFFQNFALAALGFRRPNPSLAKFLDAFMIGLTLSQNSVIPQFERVGAEGLKGKNITFF